MAETKEEILLVKKIVGSIVKRLNNFFGVKPSIHIQIIYSPEEFMFYKGYFEKWMVGTASKQNLWIFSKRVIKKHTIHKNNCFEKVLRHELVHIYVNFLSPFVMIWLNEGIAVFLSEKLSGRLKKLRNQKKISIDLFKIDKDSDETKLKNYFYAPCFVEHLVKKAGKQAFLNFLKDIKPSIAINQISKKHFKNGIRQEFKLWKKEFEK
ncbi:MAG: hypothetical protein KKF46_05575 [Nanoarchaeota archaeon]|nr:hypothetical protein [Nanoarchaeota archaeon]MBU1321802.1 hypothetical protein [Nanoarchaeota archaeon]MBU1598249.1 hypothetical protein [Nanoarchaeota archaeon]MBU2441722.1 hypothetical protein [Nanoarchaeota archaeon]